MGSIGEPLASRYASNPGIASTPGWKSLWSMPARFNSEQPTLTAATLGYPNPPDHTRPVGPREEVVGQLRKNLVEVLAHSVDALPVWAGGSPVGCNAPKRATQPLH